MRPARRALPERSSPEHDFGAWILGGILIPSALSRLPQFYDGIDPCRAAGGNDTGQHRSRDEQEDCAREDLRISRAGFIQGGLQRPGEPERPNDPDGHPGQGERRAPMYDEANHVGRLRAERESDRQLVPALRSRRIARIVVARLPVVRTENSEAPTPRKPVT